MEPCPRCDIVTVFLPLPPGLRPPAERVSIPSLPARSSSLPQVSSIGHWGQTRHGLHIANKTEHWAMLNHRLVWPLDQSCQVWLRHCQSCTCQGGRRGRHLALSLCTYCHSVWSCCLHQHLNPPQLGVPKDVPASRNLANVTHFSCVCC